MKKLNLVLLMASLACFALAACGLFAMSFDKVDILQDASVFSLVCGGLVWLFLIMGAVFQVLVSVKVKRWCKKNKIQKTKFKRPIGLIRFFSNSYAMLSDVLLVISVIALVLTWILTPTSMMAFLALALLVLSFSAHCIFNGKNYYYIINNEYIETQLKKSEGK